MQRNVSQKRIGTNGSSTTIFLNFLYYQIHKQRAAFTEVRACKCCVIYNFHQFLNAPSQTWCQTDGMDVCMTNWSRSKHVHNPAQWYSQCFYTPLQLRKTQFVEPFTTANETPMALYNYINWQPRCRQPFEMYSLSMYFDTNWAELKFFQWSD